jgi:hypothetical protein
MKHIFFFFVFSVLFFSANISNAQFKRIDTTLKIGKAGYNVFCNNKNADNNQLTVRPVGFESEAHPISFYIKGNVTKTQIDDLNNDGFPDLLVYLRSGDHGMYANLFAFISKENKSFIPVPVPDVMLDGKLREGYQGHDEFSLLEGVLMREFPLYKPDDQKDKPTGGRRIIQYQLIGSTEMGYKFKVLRSFDKEE